MLEFQEGRQLVSEHCGIGKGTVSHHGVLEGDVGVVPVLAHNPHNDCSTAGGHVLVAESEQSGRVSVLSRRGLAALARAVVEHDRVVFQRLRQPPFDLARIENRLGHRQVVTFLTG